MENNADYENILNMIRLNCIERSKYYKKQYYQLKSYFKYFKIPIIVLSSCNSVMSVSLNSFIEQKYVSIITCLISLICGIIGSIELFLQIQQQMEIALSNSKEYYLISIDIFKFLNLKKEHRQIEDKVFLDDIYTSYCKLIESSALINKKMIDNLNINKIADVISLKSNSSLDSLSESKDSDEPPLI
jgi:hypothetical protein